MLKSFQNYMRSQLGKLFMDNPGHQLAVEQMYATEAFLANKEEERRKDIKNWINFSHKEGNFSDEQAEEMERMSLDEAEKIIDKADAMADLAADREREKNNDRIISETIADLAVDEEREEEKEPITDFLSEGWKKEL